MFVAEFCVGHPLSAYTVTKIIASLCCAMMCVKDISAAICKCTPRLCEISIKQKQQNSISHLFLWNGPTAHSSWSHIIGFLMPREAEKALSHCITSTSSINLWCVCVQTAVFPPKTICFGFEVQAHQTAAVAQVFPTHNLNTFGLIPSLLRNWIACWIAFHLKTQSQVA